CGLGETADPAGQTFGVVVLVGTALAAPVPVPRPARVTGGGGGRARVAAEAPLAGLGRFRRLGVRFRSRRGVVGLLWGLLGRALRRPGSGGGRVAGDPVVGGRLVGGRLLGGPLALLG